MLHLRMNHVLHIAIPEEVYAALERTAKTTQQPLEEIAVTWLANAAETHTDSLDAVIGSFSSKIAWGDDHDVLLGQSLKLGMGIQGLSD